jgi:hypothetical protein
LTLTLMPRLCSRLAWSQCRSTEPPDSPANTGMPRPGMTAAPPTRPVLPEPVRKD